MDSRSSDQQMITDEPINEMENPNIPKLSNDMNISIAFKEIAAQDPIRYTELREAVNKAFEEVTNSVSHEEFKNILGDISFLRSKKNSMNLFSTLKSSAQSYMSRQFDEIMEEENLSELFAKKNSLTPEEVEKYIFDNQSMEVMELEETIKNLNAEIAKVQESNEILFNQGRFNQQRFNQLSERIDKLIIDCQSKYSNCVEQTDQIRTEFTNLLKDQ